MQDLAISPVLHFFLFYTLITSVIRDRSDEELLNQANRFATLFSTEGVDEVAKTAVLEAQAAGVRKVFFVFLSPSGEIFHHQICPIGRILPSVPRPSEVCLQRQSCFETITIQNRRMSTRPLSRIGSGNYYADWTNHGKTTPGSSIPSREYSLLPWPA